MSDVLYRDPTAPVDARVRDLLSRMTLREKVGQVNQRMYGWDAYRRTSDGGFELTEALYAETDRFEGLGALYGLQRADAWSGVDHGSGPGAADGAALAELVQRHVVGRSRLGIPALFVEEVPHGLMALDGTVLPVNLAIGATWDPDLYERAAAHAAAELRARGGHVALVSALDIVRDPRWGRTEECFGEDPYLAARLTEALVRGMQGAPDDDNVFAADKAPVVLKHFAGQGATVGGRNSAESELGLRELHEIHLPAARAGVRAGAAAVMAAYNEVDGMPCSGNRALLTGLLREDWGFDGLVMADGLAVDRLARITGNKVSAGALALDSGVDLSLWDEGFTHLEEAVERGLVSEKTLDTAVARVLRLKFRLGLFERQDATARPPADGAAISRRRPERPSRSCATKVCCPSARTSHGSPFSDPRPPPPHTSWATTPPRSSPAPAAASSMPCAASPRPAWRSATPPAAPSPATAAPGSPRPSPRPPRPTWPSWCWAAAAPVPPRPSSTPTGPRAKPCPR